VRGDIRVSAHPSPLLAAKTGWLKPVGLPRRWLSSSYCFSKAVPHPVRSQMAPSRQERRKADRDAAKRAPRTGAAGAAGAAAALANLDVNPLGDWTTQAENPRVGPGGYCLARHVIGCPSTQETRVQSAVNDVARDICQARPLGVI